MVERKLNNFVLSLLGYFLIGFFGAQTYSRLFVDNRIPTNEKVQEGFVFPSKLEIKCKDLDGDGKKETLANINGKSYLLKYNKQGNPFLLEYTVKPKEIISKEQPSTP